MCVPGSKGERLQEQASAFATKLAAAIFPCGDDSLSVTVSIGLTDLDAGAFDAALDRSWRAVEKLRAKNKDGIGNGMLAIAAERPRWYYLSIDSANVDWSITVDEEIPGQVPPKP